MIGWKYGYAEAKGINLSLRTSSSTSKDMDDWMNIVHDWMKMVHEWKHAILVYSVTRIDV